MDQLVEQLLTDLSQDLDRLADAVARKEPKLARVLRLESRRAAPLGAAEPMSKKRSRALEPTLYRALDEGALEPRGFDRLMTLAARARR